jgi:hypothetical protein
VIPLLVAEVEKHLSRIHPPSLRRHDHVLEIDLPDERHTHFDLPSGPAVLAVIHDDHQHVTVVALLVGYGESDKAWRTWPDEAWLTVYRREP